MRRRRVVLAATGALRVPGRAVGRVFFAVVLLVAGLVADTAVAGAASGVAAPSPGIAASGTTASTVPIQHIVVLMQENHSFDDVLGYWCDQSARCEGMPTSVTLSNGATVTPGSSPDKVPTVSHSVQGQTAAIDGGKMDGWQNVQGCAAPAYACITGYDPSQIPNLISLTSTYAVEDHAFSLHDAPSWAGHLDELGASLDGFLGNNPVVQKGYTGTVGTGWGCNATGKVATRLRVNGRTPPPQPPCIPDFSLDPTAYPYGGAWEPTQVAHVPTIMDELDAAGVSWKIYGGSNAGINGASGGWSGCPSFADCIYTAQANNLVDPSQFPTDAAAGSLPQVSFIMPSGLAGPTLCGGGKNAAACSQHAPQSMAAGDNWIGQIAHAVLTGPHAASTVLVVTWDDCGCFYDQVPPPTAPDGRQMGPREPFVVAGAYVSPGFTDSTVTSSTGSILAFIEWVFGLPALNVNDGQAYNLSGMFNFNGPALSAVPRLASRHLPAAKYQALPSTLQDDT